MKNKKTKRKPARFVGKISDALKKNYLPKKGGLTLSKGIFFTCIILSFASGLIDLVFFSGLSKSIFHLATVPIHAAILYTVISIGLISGKFFCASYIGMLKELKTHLKASGIVWYKNIDRALIPWKAVHRFLLTVSIITALSMSFNSVGEGIRKIEQTISNMTYDANNLIELDQSLKTGNKDKTSAAKGNIDATKNAQKEALDEFEKEWEKVIACRDELAEFDATHVKGEDEEKNKEIDSQRLAIKKRYANQVALNGITTSNIEYAQKSTIKNQVLAANKEFEVVDTTSFIEESINYDKAAVEETLLALVDKNYKYPDGTPISFTNDDGSLVNVQLAISRLQQGISAWQSDTGDVGESSKIFTMVATYIKASPKAGGMGVSEWLLVLFIAFVGVAQEFLIYKFTPKAHIDRSVLGLVSDYLEWENDEQEERFLLKVFKKYLKNGALTKEQAEAMFKECVENMEEDEDDIIARYSHKKLETPNNEALKLKDEAYQKLREEYESLHKYVEVQSDNHRRELETARKYSEEKDNEIVNLKNVNDGLKNTISELKTIKAEPKKVEDNSALLDALNRAENVLAEKDE